MSSCRALTFYTYTYTRGVRVGQRQREQKDDRQTHKAVIGYVNRIEHTRVHDYANRLYGCPDPRGMREACVALLST